MAINVNSKVIGNAMSQNLILALKTHSLLQNPYFTISMGAIEIFSIYAVVVYTRHIILIRQLNYDGNII